MNMYVYVNACAHVCTYGGQRLMLSVFLDCSPIVFWRLSLLLKLEPTVFNRLVGRPASIQDLSVSMHPSTGVTDVCQAHFSVDARDPTMVLMFAWQTLY